MIKGRQITPAQALSRAQDLCARAEHCSGEIRKKLSQWGISAYDADAIIEKLIKTKFIDDARFAEIFTRHKVLYGGWGRRKIAAALFAKRIDRNVIADALDTIDMDEYTARLREIISRKAATMADADTYDGRTRLFRFAASRGFEPDLIATAIRSK